VSPSQPSRGVTFFGRKLSVARSKSSGNDAGELFSNETPCSRYVHRLVVEAFIGAIPIGLEVNHISGQKTDNHLQNLDVVTHAINAKHAWDMGLRSRAVFKLAA
jgi:hypothetical protein